MNYYFIRPDENSYSIWAFYDDGTEKAHVTGMTRENAERTLERAAQPARYDDPQLKPDL